MTKMSRTQRTAVLSLHRGCSKGAGLVGGQRTIDALVREGWAIAGRSFRSAHVTTAGLIAAGIDMDAIHAEALVENAQRVNAKTEALFAQHDAEDALVNAKVRIRGYGAQLYTVTSVDAAGTATLTSTTPGGVTSRRTMPVSSLEVYEPAPMLAHLDRVTEVICDPRADADAEDRARTAVADGTARQARLTFDQHPTHSTALQTQMAGRVLRAPAPTIGNEACATCGGELNWSDPDMATCVKCGDEWSPDHFASGTAAQREAFGSSDAPKDGYRRLYATRALWEAAVSTLADDVAALRALVSATAAPDGEAYAARNRAMAALDRIAARAPQRATDLDQSPWYLHTCGAVALGDIEGPPDGCPSRECFLPGHWHPLYTLPDGA